MKISKKLPSGIVALMLASSLILEVGAAAPESLRYSGDIVVNGVLFADSDGFEISETGELTAYTGSDTVISIPAGVKSIGASVFKNNTAITEVRLPDTLTSIGDSAFLGCSKLEKVTLPESLTTMDIKAFWDCTSLTEITIPASLTETKVNFLGYGPFSGCSKLKKAVIGDGCTKLPAYIFSDAHGLETVEIPDTVTEIGASAFRYCQELTSVKLPDGLTTINGYAFADTGLTSIDVPDSVETINSGAFSGSLITSFRVPLSYKVSYLDLFKPVGPLSDCSRLNEIIIPEGVTTIDNLLTGCTAPSIKIPSGITSIPGAAFLNCKKLVSVELADSVKSIGGNAFQGCEKLETIKMPGVTSVGQNAFNNCTSLTDAEFGKALNSLGYQAFRNCSSLQSLTLPAPLAAIGEETFKACTSLKDIYLPQTIGEIDDTAFDGITDITVHGYNDTLVQEFAETKGFSFDGKEKEEGGLSTCEIPFSVTKTEYAKLRFSWDAVEDANTYKIAIRHSDGSLSSTRDLTYTTPTMTIDEGDTWEVVVLAGTDGEYGSYSFGNAARISYDDLLSAPASLTYTINEDSDSVLLSWEAAEDGENYMITGGVAGGAQTEIARTSGLSYQLTDLEDGVQYMYQVCTYRETGIATLRSQTKIVVFSIASKPTITTWSKVLPSKTVYYQNDELDLTPGKFIVKYSDNSQTEIPFDKTMASGYDMTKLGKQKVTVYYSSVLKTEYEITVKDTEKFDITDPSANFGNAVIADDTTATDIFADNDGETDHISLSVNVKETVPSDIVSLAEGAVKGMTVKKYFTAELKKYEINVESGTAAEIKQAVTIKLELPEELKPAADSTKVRDYRVVRISSDKAEVLDTGCDGTYLTFSTEKFSDFAIAYIDLSYGDVNGDDTVTMADLLLLKQYMVKVPGKTVYKAAADVTADNDVTMADLLRLKQYMVKVPGITLGK